MDEKYEYMDIGIVRQELSEALDAYPFTHMGVNGDGHLILKRWLPITTGHVIEISYIVCQQDGNISLQEKGTGDEAGMWITLKYYLTGCKADDMPDDSALLDWVRRTLVDYDYEAL